ncbi:TPA: hypothetical protein DCZ31_03585 [Patescibacteria group bacterium]|nr:hypothetical protein [Candidatus Gracilibacteria bacterium]
MFLKFPHSIIFAINSSIDQVILFGTHLAFVHAQSTTSLEYSIQALYGSLAQFVHSIKSPIYFPAQSALYAHTEAQTAKRFIKKPPSFHTLNQNIFQRISQIVENKSNGFFEISFTTSHTNLSGFLA